MTYENQVFDFFGEPWSYVGICSSDFQNAMGMKLNHHPKQPERVDAISNTRLTLVPTRNRGSQGSEKGFYQCFTVI